MQFTLSGMLFPLIVVWLLGKSLLKCLLLKRAAPQVATKSRPPSHDLWYFLWTELKNIWDFFSFPLPKSFLEPTTEQTFLPCPSPKQGRTHNEDTLKNVFLIYQLFPSLRKLQQDSKGIGKWVCFSTALISLPNFLESVNLCRVPLLPFCFFWLFLIGFLPFFSHFSHLLRRPKAMGQA